MTEKETQTIVPIDSGSLLVEVDALRAAGWRLVQVLCIGEADGAELSYSFGLELEMRSLRLKVPAGASLPSVTSLYPGAFLYENEIRDLFGVRIERIRSDWEGRVYDVAGGENERKPFSKVTVRATSSEEAGSSLGGAASAGGLAPQGGAR
jgi:ech hydrogenase subunit D